MSKADLHQRGIPGLLRLKSRLLARGQEISSEDRDVEIIEQSGLFDRSGYLQNYPDVAASGMDPIRHYIRHGVEEGRNPCVLFDTQFYLSANPDVATSGINPFRHFCEFGWKEGRNPSQKFEMAKYAAVHMAGLAGTINPLAHRLANPPGRGGSRKSDVDVILQSGLFDPEYYLRTYPEIAIAGADPVEHYVKHGAREGRSPFALFDPAYYVGDNRDVAASGMNPFRHFCEFGWKELRNPCANFDIAWYWVVHMLPNGAKGNPLLHFRQVGQLGGLKAKAVGELTAAEEDELGVLAEAMLEREGNDASLYIRLGLVLTRLKRWATAESAFRDATGLEWDSAKNHNRLAGVLAKQSKWWQAAESLLVATQLDPSRESWFYRLGEVQEKMNRFALAATAYQKAVDLDPALALHWYRLGFAHECAEQQEQARFAYGEAIRRDEREEVARFGVGIYHQERGHWREALNAYSRLAGHKPLDAELSFRRGFAHDRCYEWAEARDAYERAIALEPDIAPWHYRLGFVLERLGQWRPAADAYGAAAMLSEGFVPCWRYRQAYVLHQAGDCEQACHAYLRTKNLRANGSANQPPIIGDVRDESSQQYLERFSRLCLSVLQEHLPKDRTNPDLYYMLGQAHERLSDWDAAAQAYASAVARQNEHAPDWFYRLGFVLFQAGRYVEACEAFEETRILRRPYGVTSSRYEKNEEQKNLMEYNEYLEVLPIRDNTILYESFAGVSVSDNPLAIFEYLLTEPAYSAWTHVWVVDDMKNVPHRYRTYQNVIFVKRQTDLYRRYLATASHLVNNSTFPAWFIRRPGQKYLNTWHGTPLKTLGKDIKGNFMERKNTARNFLQCTHLISPNSHTSDVLLRQYDIASIYGGKLAETGYPRIDRMIRATDDTKIALRARLGLSADTPVVLYAPTWRGTLGNTKVEVQRLVADMTALSDATCQIVFRGHYFAEKQLRKLKLPITIAPPDVEACDLLSITDVLITDYSSIFFDFVPAKRPILYYAYDLDQYTQDRGLYFDIESMPGLLCKTMPELKDVLVQTLVKLGAGKEDYSDAQSRFCPHEDGQAARRVVEFFFDDSEECVVNRYVDSRRSLLFFVGAFSPQGITASALNLLRSIDTDANVVTLVIDPLAVSSATEKLERFSHVPDSVHVIARCGTMVQSPEERWVRDRLHHRHLLLEPEMQAVYMAAFKRDYGRILGNSRFDVLVNFDGYSVYWSTLLAAGTEPRTRKVIYLHNDMRAEYELKYPNLAGLFMVYKEYDALISVSEIMNDTNRNHLSFSLGIEPGMFDYCVNTINIGELIEKASAPLDADLEAWIDGRTVFVNLGRLSPEKGHAKLIRAFSRVHEEYPHARLLILGHGPLKHDLQILVASMGLEDVVLLAGLRANPFPLLSRCDCFVLSSDHEGQPMVLLEAMTFNRPIVATDIVGNRGVLSGGYGYLVENSDAGLADGINDFLQNKITFKAFDVKTYETYAREMFNNKVLVSSIRPNGLVKHRGIVGKTNRIVVAARDDGLGERMNAIINGMFLAERLGFSFAYNWKSSGQWRKVGADDAHHAIIPEAEFFSAEFIAQYSVPGFDSRGFSEVSGEGIRFEDLVEKASSPDFKGYLAPRLDLREIMAERPAERFDLGAVFRRIGFAEAIAKAVDIANSVNLPTAGVALHLRSGDIFYGPYRKRVHYTYKGLTLPVAKALIKKIQENGESVLLFGQDLDVLNYLKAKSGAWLQSDFDMPSFSSAAEQAMFEIVLMSRCKYIVAGSSGFAKLASWIGGIEIKHSNDFFSHREQTEISISDLEVNANSYHPLQTAFAYWFAYYYGRHSKSFELSDSLLASAYEYDPDNQLYALKRAANCFRAGKFKEGDRIVACLIDLEYREDQPGNLPLFKILTGKTLGNFNLAEDFDAIREAARMGCVHAAVLDFAIGRSASEPDPDVTLREVLKQSPGEQTRIHSIYDALMKT